MTRINTNIFVIFVAEKQVKPVTEKIFTYRSSKIFYRTAGKGKPVILLHGFGEDGDIWTNQIEFLQEHCFLIIPDLPGSGRSDMISDMSMEGMAEVIKELFSNEISQVSPPGGDLEGAGSILLGHSMGGYISLAFAEKYPELLSAFGLVHSSAFADNEEKKANRLKSISFIKKYGPYEFLRSSIPELFYPGQDGSGPSEPLIEKLVEKSRAFSTEAIVAYYEAMIARPDRSEVLQEFQKPILYIIGEHDKAVPFEQSMQQCYLPSRSHIHILRNTAHMGMLEETDKFNLAVLQFISSI
jgi:pimeloyl-ACP methyl ester carboxylesterase